MTRMICLETTERIGSLAAFDGERLLAERTLDPQGRTAQTLAPGMVQLAKSCGWTLREVDLIAVAAGPGSFTGLRIGVTAAKTLAYAAGAKLVGVNTLEAIARRWLDEGADAAESGRTHRLWAVMDAQRGEVFAACFSIASGVATAIRPVHATAIWSKSDWLAQFEPGDRLSGPVLERLRGELPASVHFVEPHLWHPTAAAVGRVAIGQFAAGQSVSPFDLLPEYFRKSAAEEKRDADGN